MCVLGTVSTDKILRFIYIYTFIIIIKHTPTPVYTQTHIPQGDKCISLTLQKLFSENNRMHAHPHTHSHKHKMGQDI